MTWPLPSGGWTILGFTTIPSEAITRKIALRLGVTSHLIDFGDMGRFFFYSSEGEIAESPEAILFKSGFTRSPSFSPLSARQLLTGNLVQPESLNCQMIRGNALLVCFSKTAPQLLAYQTLMAVPQLYYTYSQSQFTCATALPPLLSLLDTPPELDETAVIPHFLFRLAPGALTYFKNISRLFPGQVLHWREASLKIDQAKTLRSTAVYPPVDRFDDTALDNLQTGLLKVMGSYLAETADSSATLLSGGVDSALIQLLVNDNLGHGGAAPSFSFTVKAPSFQFEADYARQSSQALQTRHTFCEIQPQAYPDLLIKTIQILGQPDLYNESEPCKLALAQFVAQQAPQYLYFFAGQAADALNGITEAKKVALYQRFQAIPGSSLALPLAAAALRFWLKDKAHGLQETAKMLAEANQPASFYTPTNYVALPVGNFDLLRRCFNDQELSQTFALRRSLELQYFNSSTSLEKIHIIDLLTAGYGPAITWGQLFGAYQRHVVQFFLDEDVIGMIFAFNPKIRFLNGITTKPLLKQLLARRSFSEIAYQKKRGTTFNDDLYAWMKNGPLTDMVQAITRPGFLSAADFSAMLNQPNDFLWNLLTFDVFQKYILTAYPKPNL